MYSRGQASNGIYSKAWSGAERRSVMRKCQPVVNTVPQKEVPVAESGRAH